jgi:hypothetical protein
MNACRFGVLVGARYIVSRGVPWVNFVLRAKASGFAFAQESAKTLMRLRDDHIRDRGIAFDSNGEVFCCDHADEFIGVFSVRGDFLRRVVCHDKDDNGDRRDKMLTAGSTVAANGSGLLAVAELVKHRVRIIERDGTLVRKFGDGDGMFHYPSNITWSAADRGRVPVPLDPLRAKYVTPPEVSHATRQGRGLRRKLTARRSKKSTDPVRI